MLKEHLLKKASTKLGETRLGKTKLGEMAQFVLDEDKRDEQFGTNFEDAVNNLSNRRNCLRMIYICGAGNIIAWLAVLILPQVVFYLAAFMAIFFTKGGLLLLVLPLGFGIWGTYALIRLKFPHLKEPKMSDHGLMKSFEYQSRSAKIWQIWMVSSVMGVVNTLLISFAFFYLTKQLEFLYQ
ncbi:MAG TPA: hypothetical protein VGO50_17675 [Pyrinomonadaceae bacterium]|jgi:hypothetical protein|nr:hypothetical protein [Pyrinomonadaceae bacterium]